MMRLTTLLAAMLTAGCSCAGAQGQNLVRNGDFAQVENGRPVAWEAAGDATNVDLALSATVDGGVRCAKLACTRFTGSGGASHAMICQIGLVRLEQGKTYEFSCRARSVGIAGRAVAVAISDTSDWTNCGLSTDLSVGGQWRSYKTTFHATKSVEKTSRLQLWYTETGTFFLADVKIVETTPPVVTMTDVVPSAGGKNLVPNGSFSVGFSGWSSTGIPVGWGNDLPRLNGVLIGGERLDYPALLIPLGGAFLPESRFTTTLYFDYFQAVAQQQTRLLAATEHWIPVAPGVPYTLSCDMRAAPAPATETLGVVACSPGDPVWARRTLRTTVAVGLAWKRYSYTFTTDKRYIFVTIGPDYPDDSRISTWIAKVQLERGDRATDFEPRAPVEFGLAERNGSVQGADTAPLFDVWVGNHTPNPLVAHIAFEATDYWDRPVPIAPIDVRIEGRSRSAALVGLHDNNGFARIRATCTAAGRTEIAAIQLALVPTLHRLGRELSDTVIGINHAFSDAFLIHQASLAGVSWYRDWSLKRQQIEPQPGEYHWEIADTQIDRVLKEHVNLMALLPPFPSADWDSEAAPGPSAADRGAPGRQAWAPKDPAKMEEFVRRAAERYKGRVKVWEFLNEPIFTEYALPSNPIPGFAGPKYTPADYVALLKVAARGIRAGNPASLVMGGIASGPESYTHELLEAGILGTIDLFNLHIYPGRRPPESFIPGMDKLLKDMDAHGGRKPIWITEFSYYAADNLPTKPFLPGDGWAEGRLLDNERQCAEYTVRFMTIMLAHGVEKVFIHSGASGSVNAPELECCLFDYGGVPRKIVPALAVFANMMGAKPKCVLDRDLGNDCRADAFETGSRSVVVAWCADTDAKPTIAPPPGVHVFDFMGRDIAGKQVTLGSAPVYLVGASGTGKRIAEALRAPGG